mmetsp:Transcript_89964/g.233289  ORF Transcript_89964/g.233289 Transcript_89964/m.233289 type:complete len:996 (-) Transcript_89964:31-3018(-)
MAAELRLVEGSQAHTDLDAAAAAAAASTSPRSQDDRMCIGAHGSQRFSGPLSQSRNLGSLPHSPAASVMSPIEKGGRDSNRMTRQLTRPLKRQLRPGGVAGIAGGASGANAGTSATSTSVAKAVASGRASGGAERSSTVGGRAAGTSTGAADEAQTEPVASKKRVSIGTSGVTHVSAPEDVQLLSCEESDATAFALTDALVVAAGLDGNSADDERDSCDGKGGNSVSESFGDSSSSSSESSVSASSEAKKMVSLVTSQQQRRFARAMHSDFISEITSISDEVRPALSASGVLLEEALGVPLNVVICTALVEDQDCHSVLLSLPRADFVHAMQGMLLALEEHYLSQDQVRAKASEDIVEEQSQNEIAQRENDCPSVHQLERGHFRDHGLSNKKVQSVGWRGKFGSKNVLLKHRRELMNPAAPQAALLVGGLRSGKLNRSESGIQPRTQNKTNPALGRGQPHSISAPELRDVGQPLRGISFRPWLYERSMLVSRRRLPQRRVLHQRKSQQLVLELEVLRSGLHTSLEAAFRRHVHYWRSWRQQGGHSREGLPVVKGESIHSVEVVAIPSEGFLTAPDSDVRSDRQASDLDSMHMDNENLGTSCHHLDDGESMGAAADCPAHAAVAAATGHATLGNVDLSTSVLAEPKAMLPALPSSCGVAGRRGQLPALMATPLVAATHLQPSLSVTEVHLDGEGARSAPGKIRRKLPGGNLGRLRQAEGPRDERVLGSEILTARSEADLPAVTQQCASTPLQIAREMSHQYLQHFEVDDMEEFLNNLATDQAAGRSGSAGRAGPEIPSAGNAHVACWPDFLWPGQPSAEGGKLGEDKHGASKELQSRGHSAATDVTTLPSLGLSSAVSTAEGWRRVLETREGRGGTPLSSRASRRLDLAVADAVSDRALTANGSARNPPLSVVDITTRLPSLSGGSAKARGLASVCHGLEQRMFAEATPHTTCCRQGDHTSAPSAPGVVAAAPLKDMWVCGSDRRYVPTRRRLKGL